MGKSRLAIRFTKRRFVGLWRSGGLERGFLICWLRVESGCSVGFGKRAGCWFCSRRAEGGGNDVKGMEKAGGGKFCWFLAERGW